MFPPLLLESSRIFRRRRWAAERRHFRFISHHISIRSEDADKNCWAVHGVWGHWSMWKCLLGMKIVTCLFFGTRQLKWKMIVNIYICRWFNAFEMQRRKSTARKRRKAIYSLISWCYIDFAKEIITKDSFNISKVLQHVLIFITNNFISVNSKIKFFNSILIWKRSELLLDKNFQWYVIHYRYCKIYFLIKLSKRL